MNEILKKRDTPGIVQPVSLEQLLKRPELTYADIKAIDGTASPVGPRGSRRAVWTHS